METEKKPHFSITQLEMSSKCWEQWRRRYEERQVIKPGFAAIRGSTVHSAAEINLKQKITTGRDLPVRELLEIADAQFEGKLLQGYEVNGDDIGRNPEIALGEAKDASMRLTRLHALAQAPHIKPLAVEETVRIKFPDLPRDLLAVIDVVEIDGEVKDLKTAAKSKTQDDADNSIQLTAYHLARQVQTGTSPKKLSLDILVDTGSTQSRQELVTTRDDLDVEIFARKFVQACKQVEAGSFPPAAPGVWWCSAKWCGYHSTCRFVRPGKKTQGD